jgi:lactoylglutathione lyase
MSAQSSGSGSSPGATKVRQLFPMLSVADLTRSLRFYAEALGGERSYQFPEEGDPAFVVLRFGESELGIGGLGDEPPLHGQALRPVHGHRVEFCAYVGDLDAAVERLRAEATPVLLEPSETPWGERIAYVSDPDGNLLMLTEAST